MWNHTLSVVTSSTPGIETYQYLREKQIELIAKKQSGRSESTDVYSEHMHLYQSVCTLANQIGTEGRLSLRDGFNAMKKRQADIIAKQCGQSKGTLSSMPMTSTKTVDKRIQSRGSPKKK